MLNSQNQMQSAVQFNCVLSVDLPQVLHEYQQLEPQRERVVLVRRSNILNHMVEEFKDPRILHDIVTFD